ncbi:retrovirus-related pol polyprotein from transposon TNT 1-94, partial [Tanacetum coccineum]
MSQRRLLASLQAPFLKEKKGVRFSALYLQQKRNLLVLDHSHQQVSVVKALTTSANVPSIYIQLFWNTLTHDAKTGVYSFQVDEHWLTLSADLLRKALNVTPADSAHPFESPPAGKTDITFTRRRVPSNWLMKMKFNRLLNLIWMIMSTIYNKTSQKTTSIELREKAVLQMYKLQSHSGMHKPKKHVHGLCYSRGDYRHLRMKLLDLLYILRILHHKEVASPVFPQGVAAGPTIEDTSITQADLHPSVNPVAGEPGFAQSTSGDVSLAEPIPISTRKQLAFDALWCCYSTVLSKVEPKNFKMAVNEDSLFEAMQDEIHEFDKLKVWELVPRPDYVMVIGLKWIYKVKLDEYGDVLKNKARIVAKGYHGCQTAFLNGDLLEEVFVSQPEVDIRQNTNFVRAFTTSANVPSIYIQLFWNTLTHDAKTGVYSFQVDEHWLTLSADLLRKALNVTPADSAHPFESPPAGKTDITFTRRRVPSNWLMKMKFNRLLNLIWMIMSTIYNKTTRKLPVVEVKGKGSATDRWIIASQDETTGPSVHPEDATSTKMVRETLSHANAESGGNSEKINSETDTEILNVGSNSEQSHVALAGPNPEHMHDVFLATNYPKVHESLKHTTKEHVQLENPPSSS